ncbi:uncharacterized protein N7473_011759 [Penicillium subrubescens]|uniref:beta-fructofuranosidase n=1 Tax=Penicillium subrubescens TaxID=1316194 RepID=A0A1Q5TM54_9EURO|nr:uncharacterized protein N7473_011759 [Penicillium subrubescens]KAJ5880706.1 hypothetical protein N7473_011759 [Penicillium subrubescens]OKP01317.1 Beta-fructosidase [Penicillium subrubescens]
MKRPTSSSLSYILPALSLSFVPPGVFGKPISRTTKCTQAQHPGPSNPSFETGDLTGWQVLSGTAFGNSSVTALTSYWGGPFNQKGKYFVDSFVASGDPAIGQLRSESFRASSYLSFLIGGGYDPVNLYVGLVRDSDGALLVSQTGMNDEALIRIIWDTSAWAGQNVHLLVYDNNSGSSWAHINIDDVRTGCNALQDDNGLTFTVFGEANQPATGSSPSCNLYAADVVRPQYHYTPYQGWINDPAGLIQWNGQHHLFSQFYPDAPLWGPMHWSHATSPDAVHWAELPAALYPPYPNNPQDTSGRWTGSAVNDSQNRLHLVFTDFTDLAFHPGATEQVVSTATSSDGTSYSLYPQNPVIGTVPPNSGNGFRDPKVFHDPTDNSWKLVVGSGDGSQGKVHLYRSTDLLSWTYVGVLFEGDGFTGSMWECPNFFPVGNKWVLFYGGRSLGWFEVGTYNGTSFTSETRGLLDAGPDSYAMQWYQDAAGRNLAITWLGNWPTSKWPSRLNGWAGQQSITRELFIRPDGGLGSRPIPELASLEQSGNAKSWTQKTVGDTAIVLGHTTTARLRLTVDVPSASATSFSIRLFSSSAEFVLVSYNFATRILTLDTSNAGYGQTGQWQPVVVPGSDGKLSLDIFLDRSTLEIFSSDGVVTSARVYPRYQESQDITIEASGHIVFDSISLTPLGSSWC